MACSHLVLRSPQNSRKKKRNVKMKGKHSITGIRPKHRPLFVLYKLGAELLWYATLVTSVLVDPPVFRRKVMFFSFVVAINQLV
jgi:hypothetical protein